MKKFYILSVALIFTGALSAQSLTPEVIATAGDYYENEYGSLSWTLGEPVIETFSNQEIILTQGFQQSYYQVVSIENPDTPTFVVDLYPNPARDFIFIDVKSLDKEPHLKIEMFDFTGNKILEKETMMTSYKDKVNLTDFATNMLMLRVTDCNTQKVHIFKIIKVKF